MHEAGVEKGDELTLIVEEDTDNKEMPELLFTTPDSAGRTFDVIIISLPLDANDMLCFRANYSRLLSLASRAHQSQQLTYLPSHERVAEANQIITWIRN